MDCSLCLYERHVGSFICALFLFLGFVSYMNNRGESSQSEEISICLVGAVKPQTVRVLEGTTVDELLSKVICFDEADLQEINGMRRLMKESILVVPYRDFLTLFVRGAVVEERVVTLQRGATSEDILAHIEPLEGADIQRFLQKKRYTNGSVLEIFQRKRSAKKDNSRCENS